jgi:hypothetical protein
MANRTHLELTNPALQKYVAEKVSTREFPSAEAVVEDALNRAMQDDTELTPEDWEGIRKGDEEIQRGEYVDSTPSLPKCEKNIAASDWGRACRAATRFSESLAYWMVPNDAHWI